MTHKTIAHLHMAVAVAATALCVVSAFNYNFIFWLLNFIAFGINGALALKNYRIAREM